MAKKDNVKGDYNEFHAGSMMVKFVQNNYNKVPGGWAPADDDDYTEYEEVDAMKTAQKVEDEEPNCYPAGRFLKEVLNGKWFEEVRTHQGYTSKWREAFVDALLDSDYRREIAKAYKDKYKRESLKGYVVGCLKDAGVISGTYDGIARQMNYSEDSYRTFSRYLGRGKNQDYFLWIKDYVEKSKLEP